MQRRDCLRSLGLLAGAVLPLASSEKPVLAGSLGCEQIVPLLQTEFHLISHRLTPSNFEELMLWDAKKRSWQAQPPGHVVVQSRIMVLHFWAEYCAPCREEFPFLKKLAREFSQKLRGQVQFLFVSDSSSSETMALFADQNQAILPWGESPHYLDTDQHLQQLLGGGLPSGRVPLPTTVICDPFIVRQAIVGPLMQRRNDLHGAIDRLVQTFSPTP